MTKGQAEGILHNMMQAWILSKTKAGGFTAAFLRTDKEMRALSCRHNHEQQTEEWQSLSTTEAFTLLADNTDIGPAAQASIEALQKQFPQLCQETTAA